MFKYFIPLQHCRALVDSGLVPVLLNGLFHVDPRFVESCLCCLVNISPIFISAQELTDKNQFKNCGQNFEKTPKKTFHDIYL
jgi:hypothetical protein